MSTEQAQQVQKDSESEGEYVPKELSSEDEESEHDGVESSVHSSINLNDYLKARDGIPSEVEDEEGMDDEKAEKGEEPEEGEKMHSVVS